MPFAVLVIALMLTSAPLAAQTTVRDPVATLLTWADDVWIALLDRDGAWHGRLADEGIFQRFNAAEDHEYQLDVRTSLFSASDDGRWAVRPVGLRAAAGSINHPHIAQRVEWNEGYAVTPGWVLGGRYLRERTLSATRDYVRAGLFWNPVPAGPWEVGATMGLHFFKPSADVELIGARSWSGPDGSRGRVEVRVGLLDAFSDLVFNGLGVDPEDVDAHFDYRVQPVAVRADGVWTVGGLRFELRGGVSRHSLVQVTFPATGDEPYELHERVAFAGGLIEVRPGSRTTLAALTTWARADTERLGDSPSSLDLSLQEVTREAGARARHGLTDDLSLEADILWKVRPENRRTAWRAPTTGGLAVEHSDGELLGAIALVRRPAVGWTGRALLVSLDRDADPLRPELTSANQRLVLEGGYRFGSGFELTAGLRWDVDAWREQLFDGGQVRFTTGAP